MLIGEAWGEDEARERKPFVGTSGKLLNQFLAAAGIRRQDCYITNVFNQRPPRNEVVYFCGPKETRIPGFPPLGTGKYVRAEFQLELDRLFAEVRRERPTLIVALGASAAWALLKTNGIKSIRGYVAMSHLGVKVLPTYHPAAIGREPKLRPLLFADLKKAATEVKSPQLNYTPREIWIEPSLQDLERFERRHIMLAMQLSVDCETIGNQITCISIAPSKHVALVVPFLDPNKPGRNYWSSLREEVEAWKWIHRILTDPHREVIGQNFLYDLGFLWRSYGIPVRNIADDTMYLHHAMQPEMEKSLAYLASLYANCPSWKWMRTSHTLKKED